MLSQELTRRLKNSDPQVAYCMMFLYEAFNEQQKQLDMLTNVAAMLAEQNSLILGKLGQAEIANNLKEAMREIQNHGKEPGIEVSSVAPDPEKGETH